MITFFVFYLILLTGCPGTAPPKDAIFEIGVAITGTGEGTVPAGSSTASGMYETGFSFTATASPEPGSVFTGWYGTSEHGNLKSIENPYNGSLEGFTTLFARFDLDITRHDLTSWESIGIAGWGARVAVGDLPENFRIWNAPDGSEERDLLGLVYSQAMRRNGVTLEWEPVLAESWVVSAGAVTVTLHDALYWSDGVPLTADDFIFAASIYQSGLVTVTRDLSANSQPTVWTVDNNQEYTVTSSGDYDALLDIASIEPLPEHKLGPIVVSGGMSALNTAWGINTALDDIVGSGPFILNELKLGESVTLEKNPYYFEEDTNGLPLPYLSAVRLIEGGSVTLFNTGEVDLCDVSSGDLLSINRNGAIVIETAGNVYEAYRGDLANFSDTIFDPFDGPGWRVTMAKLYFE
jgi:ABC-type transport system substrate-binding protein